MNTTAHRFALSFSKLGPDAPCFPLNTAISGVSDSRDASKVQSAAKFAYPSAKRTLGKTDANSGIRGSHNPF